jgi:protein-tyrosine kinase
MSRIDEALRRATEDELKSEHARQIRITPPVGPEEVTSLSREPFPAETHSVRAARSNVTPIEPVRATRVTTEQEQTSDTRTPSTPSSLFERLDGRLAEKIVVDHKMSPASREQYRRLAATLHDAQGTSDLRVIMVASALPGEGKTLTASNLALTLSESYRRRVLLIDADLRKPMLQQLFRLNTTSGLIDGLDSPTDVKLILRQVSSQLWVLPAGRPTSDPMAGLTSDRMRRVLEEAKQTFDWIIIDTPPLVALADAHLLSSLVDAAVLVVKANSTPHDMVNRAADVIGRNRVIGVVLNQAAEGRHGGYAGYYSGQYLRALDDGTRS